MVHGIRFDSPEFSILMSLSHCKLNVEYFDPITRQLKDRHLHVNISISAYSKDKNINLILSTGGTVLTVAHAHCKYL